MSDNTTWRWCVGPNTYVTLAFNKEPTWDSLTMLRRVLDVTLEAYALPRVAPKEVGGVRVIRVSDPWETAA